MGIFEEIRSSTDGIIGSFITTGSGEVAASDVPALFNDELGNASESLFYLADIVQESKDFESLLIEAQDGYICFTKGNVGMYLGVIASSDVNLQVLNLVTKKAATNLELPQEVIFTEPESYGTSVPAVEKVVPESPIGISENDRDAIFSAIIGKIQLLYGPKVAGKHLDDALASVNAKRSTLNPDQISKALNILADGVLKKMMGDKAKPFVEKACRDNGLL
ncbi:MAG TPA: hypothetical protein C5S51_01860 [Methanosarcinaceae archaeon]|nr:hypothetical protein [Methanosarcinaceae archaeon]